MASNNHVIVPNLGTEFDIGVDTANKITVKLQASLVKNAAGEIGVDLTNLTLASNDAGQILSVGTDGGVYLNQAAIQAVETAWAGSEATGFMSVTPAGTNGHAPTFAFDFTNAQFVEGVQDAVGQAIISATDGLEYDDIANTIATTLGNLTFGNGLTTSGTTAVAVLADPNSPSLVTIGPAGVSVTPGISADANNLAQLGTDNKVFVDSADVVAAVSTASTEVICDAFGVQLAKALPI